MQWCFGLMVTKAGAVMHRNAIAPIVSTEF
jgi:hypothetical protein